VLHYFLHEIEIFKLSKFSSVCSNEGMFITLFLLNLLGLNCFLFL